MIPRGRPRGSGERGAVTAEFALGLPLVLAVTVGLVWLLAVAATQIRVVDSAREAARAAARGEAESDARAVAVRVAPPGATLTLAREGDQVVVTCRAEVEGPGGLFDFLPPITLTSTAVALAEQP